MIEVRESEIHGKGVFAKENIKGGCVVEECHYLIMDKEALDEYIYSHRQRGGYMNLLALGNGSLYNHSDNNNITWSVDESRRVIVFKSIHDIEKDEELFIHYGKHWWKIKRGKYGDKRA